MNGSSLLDTNIVTALFAEEPIVVRRAEETPEIFLCSPVLGELYYGAYKSARRNHNLERIHKALEKYEVLACDRETSRVYGQIQVELERKGRRIPQNDIWIAALARQHKLKVVSRDAHFREVDGLEVEEW